MTACTTALGGVRVVEIGGGIAAAYCGRLLVDCGAALVRVEPAGGDPLRRRREVVGDPATEGLLHAFLSAGKEPGEAADRPSLDALCRGADIVIVGEESGVDAAALPSGRVVVDLSWFAGAGPYAGWAGSDLVVQALTGMVHVAGPEEGPPFFLGDCQASFIGGLTAYVAAMAGLMAPAGPAPRRFETGIFEANMILCELQLAYAQTSGEPGERCGVNRYKPNSPIGIYPCREGWLGLTALTPPQWESLCDMLGMAELARDPDFDNGVKRYERIDVIDAAIVESLASRSADEWAGEGRKRRIPMVVVPDAAGILAHPVFAERGSLAAFTFAGRGFGVPRTPFALSATPVRAILDETALAGDRADPMPGAADAGAGGLPLAGLRIADFSMGWAGPLATRILADLGAEVIKIEAGRYPDWWRAVDWSPEAIERRQYEESLPFAALNRGKLGTAVDLTRPEGRDLALSIVARSDAVVENQAARVMDKLGLGFDAVSRAAPDIVMMSMSAFGSGNAWSETRAYGSTLEQGSGLPSFAGRAGDPPTMMHLAYGDAVGGLYGCGALMTALVHRRRTGCGQFVNLSMVECMLQFTAPALLARQATGREPQRRGNRHAACAPHGCFPAAGDDCWVAVAVTGDAAFASLARLLGREDWLAREGPGGLAGRVAHEDEFERELAGWTRARDAAAAARTLQAHGIAAAPVVRLEHADADPQLEASGFYVDIERAVSGLQRQCGLAVTEGGRRFAARRPAPSLGGDSRAVLKAIAGVGDAHFEALAQAGVVGTSPTALRAAPSVDADVSERRKVAS